MSVSLSTLKLGGVLKKFRDFSIETFEDRLILQKRIYLIQAFGLYLGYNFSWYIHGPYSPDLTRDAYKLDAIYELVPELKFEKSKYNSTFEKYIEFLDDRSDDGDWLEQLACTHFLKQIYPDKHREEIIQLVLEHEEHFNRRQCEDAYGYLVEWGLIE